MPRGLAINISWFSIVMIVLSFADLKTVFADCEFKQHHPRVALVIGNSRYQYVGELPNAVNDARDIARVLKAYEFSVLERLDLNHKQMQDAVNCFAHTLQQEGVGLFYYAGHGVQIGDRNYLLPADFRLTQINPAEQVQRFSIQANKVLGLFDAAKTKTNIIILDACRNNPFRSLSRSLNDAQITREMIQIADKNGLAPMLAPPGSFIAFATDPGSFFTPIVICPGLC